LAETIADSLTATTDEGGIDEPTRRLALRLTDEAHRAAATVDGLLELSQMDERRQPRARVSLGAIVDESVERVTATAEDRMADIVRDGDDVLVWGDERQLVSAVSNLLENAVKYSESGSPIRVTVAEHSDSIAVTVGDQGIGIAPHDQPRIFDRFFRVDRARRRATGGTGLGLAIVRQVAIAHGGDVSVASREGEGSTFVLRLPKDAR
jgi:two-component system sensor histidine kinase SenX3